MASALLLLASTVKKSSVNSQTQVHMQSRPMAAAAAAAAPGSYAAHAFATDAGWQDPPLESWPPTYSPASQDRRPADVSMSPTMAISIVALLLSFTFDGHTVSEGNRWITGAVDMVHVVAGAVWAGGVLALAIVLWRRHHRRLRLDALELAVRFSVIAGAELAAAGVAGTILAVIILDSLSELWTTPWGLLLIAKFTAVVAAAGLGTFNNFVVIPRMETDPGDDSRSLMLRNTETGEGLLLCIVLLVTALLVGAASS